MSSSTTGRHAATTLLQSVSRPAAASSRCGIAPHIQSFSTSPASLDNEKNRSALTRRQNLLQDVTMARFGRAAPPARSESMAVQAKAMARSTAQTVMGRAVNDPKQLAIDAATRSGDLFNLVLNNEQQEREERERERQEEEEEPYHFHILSHKHNTHVTVTKPNRDAILSLSCGNLGFRKSQRKSYDAAYQLGAYTIDKLLQQGWHHKIKKMEVCLRGFGQGREAVTKVLLGNEGKLLVNRIVQVSDTTRLKFGGTRSKNARRL